MYEHYVRYSNYVSVCYLLLGWWYLILAAHDQTVMGKPRKERDKYMSKNLTRKGLAFGAGMALVATGLAAMPAQAAAGDLVSLSPSTGLNYGTFTSDVFSLKSSVSTQVVTAGFAIKIDNPDQDRLLIDLDSDQPISELDLIGISSTGVQTFIQGGDNFDVGTARNDGAFVVDFEAAAIVSLVLAEFRDGTPGVSNTALNSNVITIELSLAGIVTDATTSTAVTFASGSLEAFDLDASDTVAGLAYGAGDKSVTVTSWVESEAVADYETVDTNYASLTRTVTWYDPKNVVVIPRIERVNSFFNDGTSNLYGSVAFNKPINLEQFDTAKWAAEVTTGSTLPLLSSNTDLNATDVLPTGLSNADNAGRWYFDTGAQVAADTTFRLNLHSNLAETATVERWWTSTGYSIGAGTAVANSQPVPAITDTVDVDFTQVTATSGGDNFATASIRAGVKSVTYTSQLQVAGVDAKTASVPMLAVVKAGSFLPTGSSLSVAGNASSITKANEQRTVTGFTNSAGKFSVTVNSAVAAKNETYTVDFYVLLNGAYSALVPERGTAAASTTGGTDISKITATYATATAGAASLKAVSDVVAGANPVVKFSVTDQFGTAINESATGKQLYISLIAPNKDNLEVSAAVVDGEVSFTFANYLTVGGSDLLTATLYTGSASNPTTVDTEVVTLYNTGATGVVQVPETLSGVVTYRDFIADGAKVVAGVTVDPDQDIAFTGTIVDAAGVGIPAAVVTISAPGMQIQDGNRYYVGTRTTNANAAGVFSVNLNAHMVNTTGTTVTVTTADGKTASTLVKTYFPQDTDSVTAGNQAITGSNLNMTVDMPANIVMNQTYGVTATLTDKWGNPVRTSTQAAVHFLGTGSIQVNGVSSEVERQFNASGEALVYIRSVKDIAGPGNLEVILQADTQYTYWTGTTTAVETLGVAESTTDVAATAWDERTFKRTFSADVQVLTSEADIVTAQKVNAGSFKGYVALYALGYEGQRMSAKVGNDWVIVPSIPAATNDLFRAVEFVGAGVDISVRIYIDRVLVATIPLLTK
jgi:hypothetical protein